MNPRMYKPAFSKLRLLILVGIVLPVLLRPLMGIADSRSDPAYGELVKSSGPVRAPKPGAQVKVITPKDWRTSFETWSKNAAGNLAYKTGVDEKTIKNFTLPDDYRRIYLITELRKSIHEQDWAVRILSPSHPLSKRVSMLVSPHRFELGDLSLSVKIYDEPGMETFSSPDGSIRLERRLLERLSDAEILALFGHELGHIVLMHQDKQIEQDSAVKFFLYKFSGQKKTGLIDWLKNSQSKKHEFQADDFSFDWAKYHGYDLKAHYTIFDKLTDMQAMPGYPSIDERAKRIRGKLKWNALCHLFSKSHQ